VACSFSIWRCVPSSLQCLPRTPVFWMLSFAVPRRRLMLQQRVRLLSGRSCLRRCPAALTFVCRFSALSSSHPQLRRPRVAVALVMRRLMTSKFTRTRIRRLRVCVARTPSDASLKARLRAGEVDESGPSKVKVDGGARLWTSYKARCDKCGGTKDSPCRR
jgi:hypothetical protein